MPERPYVSTFLDERRFTQTKNPVYVIKAFIEAHDQDKYPPKWALDFVAKKFKEFDTSYGKKDLNKLLGFKKGKGQSPAYIEYFTKRRYKHLCMDVFQLVTFLDISVEFACSIVACKLSETLDYDMGFNLQEISEKTIMDKYYKIWGKKFQESASLKEQLDNPSKEDILEFLRKFDKDFLSRFKQDCSALKAYLPYL